MYSHYCKRCGRVLQFIWGVWWCEHCDIKYSPKQIVDQETWSKNEAWK